MGISILINESSNASSYAERFPEYKMAFQATHYSDYERYVTLTDTQWKSARLVDEPDERTYILNPTQKQINGITGTYQSEIGYAKIQYINGKLIYNANGKWEAEIHYLRSDPNYFCITSNYSSGYGLCGELTTTNNGNVTKFKFDYPDSYFVYTFTKAE